MSISTIRKYTDEDAERVEAAAKRFCEARGIKPEVDVDRWGADVVDYTSAVENWLYSARYEVDYADIRAWRRAFARALRERPCAALTVGYGYVGMRCN